MLVVPPHPIVTEMKNVIDFMPLPRYFKLCNCVYLLAQQTPNPEAHEPMFVPDLALHSSLETKVIIFKFLT